MNYQNLKTIKNIIVNINMLKVSLKKEDNIDLDNVKCNSKIYYDMLLDNLKTLIKDIQNDITSNEKMINNLDEIVKEL